MAGLDRREDIGDNLNGLTGLRGDALRLRKGQIAMTNRQKLELRASEIRAKLTELAGVDALTDEQRGEIDTLRTEYADTERKIQAASIGDDQPEGREARTEDRQLAELIGGADVGAIFTATLEHRATDGQTAELQQHFGLGANQVPLALLRGTLPVEARATGVTPAPADVGATQAAIVPAVFPASCAAFLGVDMPTVGVGEAVFPVLTTSADVNVPAENIESAETAGAFSADVLSPARLQASFFYSREDRARFSGMGEALRMNLSDALSDKLDQQVLNGDEGLLNGTVLANHNVSTETTYALYRSQFAYGRVDGTYATGTGELKVVMGSAPQPSRTPRDAVSGQQRQHRRADGDGRGWRGCEGERSRAGRIGHEAEHRDPARDAPRHGGAHMGGRDADSR